MEAAIAQRDWDKANALLVETRAMAPDDARVSLMEARIARAAGQGGRALRALERAQQQMAARGGAVPRDDSAAGVALGLAYSRNAVTADIGTTPLGFRQQAVIGGVELAPALNDTLRLRVTAERRAVTDSLLAWAGMRDPNSGQSWSGVTRHGGRVQREIGSKPVGFYVGGGYAEFRGDHVAKNSRVEAGAAWSILRRPEEKLVAGLDLVYFGYDNNQRLFTYGNGGYFSPQSYVATNIPLDWRRREGDLAWRVGGTIGYQAYKEDAAKYFPLDPGLQAQAETAAAGDPSLRAAQPSATKSGVTGGVRGDIEYAVTGNLKLGGLLRHDRTGDWNEARGMLFARYRFGP